MKIIAMIKEVSEQIRNKSTINNDENSIPPIDQIQDQHTVARLEGLSKKLTTLSKNQQEDEVIQEEDVKMVKGWLEWTAPQNPHPSSVSPIIAEQVDDWIMKINKKNNVFILPPPIEHKSNGAGMPSLLLTPHRIVGPAFLGLGVLAIIILGMFAG